jgi:proteasome lid subunit RPN8/RPN11
MRGQVRVRAAILARMLEEARRHRSEECCGLLAGADGVITDILPARNQLASATAYEIAPDELFRLFKQIRAARLEHLGIYHSHPTGENSPSPRDIERAFYPDVAYFIVSPDEAKPGVRAFQIREGVMTEIEIIPL